MINAVDRELCAKLYLKYGWDSAIPGWWAKSAYSGQWTTVPSKTYKAQEFHDEPGAGDFYDHMPAYDLEFLIDKLPLRSDHTIEANPLVGRDVHNTGWAIIYMDIVCRDRYARNAVAKLLLELPDSVKELL